MSSEPAVALVVAYLQLNGYFLITEQELHTREPEGYRSVTDIDIIAIRPPDAPGPAHHHRGAPVEECTIITEVDPALDIDPGRFDVIIGEVKTAEAALNPGLRTPGALHAALRRTGDLYTELHDRVVDGVIARGFATTPSARVRLVVFAGRGRGDAGATVHLADAAAFIRGHLRVHKDLYRVTRFSDPVLGLLALLDKVG